MADLTSLLNNLPIGDLATRLGADSNDVNRALESLLPSLVGGMQANAQTEQGAASLENALAQHVNGAQTLEEVDEVDGAKIAAHVFGDNEGAVVSKVAEHSGVNLGVVQKLLPVVAPLVMAFLASRFFGNRAQQAPQAAPQQVPQDAPAQGGGLGDLLGGMLGGSTTGGGLGGLGGGFGNILGSLGGLLGGGR